ncbi:MAG: glycine--tRNA ligase, partial [Candidatus Methanomethylophilaceae archaeon]
YCQACREPFRADHLVKGLHPNPDVLSPSELEALIRQEGVRCPECQGELGPVEEFNLMFKTNIGPGSSRVGYLRPETAQGIFINYPLLYRHNRERLPLGIIQTGRGYRNEISPRQGMVRLREFNMMEVELFVDPEDKGWVRFPQVADRMLRLIPADGEEVELTVAEAVEKGIIANQVLAYFVWLTFHFLTRMGVDPARLRFRQHEHDEMAHYAADCWDAEALLSYGWTEIVGIADRGCWDLSRHSRFSGVDMTHFKKFEEPLEVERETVKARYKALGPLFKGRAKDIAAAIEACSPHDIQDGKLSITVDGERLEIGTELFELTNIKEKIAGERVVPHVIEPSHGLDRIFYTILEHAYDHREEDDYTVLRLKPEMAPVKVGVFPLMSRDGLDDEAQRLHRLLQSAGLDSFYDDSGSIGKRYARMDEIGTPWCVTVDYETLEPGTEAFGTVTLRDRDSTAQVRVRIEDLVGTIRDRLSRPSSGTCS